MSSQSILTLSIITVLLIIILCALHHPKLRNKMFPNEKKSLISLLESKNTMAGQISILKVENNHFLIVQNKQSTNVLPISIDNQNSIQPPEAQPK